MKKRFIMLLIAAASTLLISTNSFASGEDSSGIPIQDFSLTISPVHLLISTVELNGEFNLNNNFGLALIGGIGQPTFEYSDGTEDTFTLYEVGGQLIGYPFGTFRHGMQIGIEGIYMNISTSSDNVDAEGLGFSGGAFAGYKFISQGGFTFCIQLGVQKVFAKATSGSDSASDSAVMALLNLNFGYSF